MTKVGLQRCHSLLAFGVALFAIGSHAESKPKGGEPKIAVRVSAAKETFALGDSIPIRVEIANVGSQQVFVSRELTDVGGYLSLVEFEVQDQQGRLSEEMFAHADRIPTDPRVGFAYVLARDWLALAPGQFFGTTFTLDLDRFPFLQKPGRYLIKATYSSSGMLGRFYYNQIQGWPEEIKKLPYPDWKGSIKSNAVWVNVTPRAPGTKTK